MDKPPYDWSKFAVKIGISRDQAIVYDAWTSQEGIESWFLEKAEFTDPYGKVIPRRKKICVGNTYRWEWHVAEDVARGEVLGLEDSKSLSFTFLGCRVLVSIYEAEGETMVEIEQSSIPTDDASRVSYHLGCTRGWTFYLANLKSVLEGGHDLRNRNVGLLDVVNT